MKITELFNINAELEKKKAELESLKEEAELIQTMIKIDLLECEKVKVDDLYIIKTSEVYLFTKMIKEKSSTLGSSKYSLINILNGEQIGHWYINISDFIRGDDFIFWYYNDRIYYKDLVHATKKFPILLCYPDGMIPLNLIKKLYYDINNIDSKTLKKCYDISYNN